MISDAEGLAWLKGIYEQSGKSTSRFTDGTDWFVRSTRSIPSPQITRDCLIHVIGLVEKRVRFQVDNAEAIRKANEK